MYRLHVLGTPQLVRISSGDVVPIGRHGLALLAGLAIAGPRGLTRDRIAALFWAESDDRQAGNSLRQLLYRVRKALRDEVVRGDVVLALNEGIVDVDLWQVRAAIAGRRPEDAIASYGGPLLDGFHLSSEGDFEEWVEAERERTLAGWRQALSDARDAASARQDFSTALDWSSRLTALDPLGCETALAHADLLRRRDLTQALGFLKEYAKVVSREFGGVDKRIAEAVAALERHTVSGLSPQLGIGGEWAPVSALPTERATIRETAPSFRRALARTRVVLLAALILLVGKADPLPRSAGALQIDDMSAAQQQIVFEFVADPSADSTADAIAARAAERGLWSFRQSEGWGSAIEPRDLAAPTAIACHVAFSAEPLGEAIVLRGRLVAAGGRELFRAERVFPASESEVPIGEVRDELLDQLALRYHPLFRLWNGADLSMRPEAARPFARGLEWMSRIDLPFAGDGWLEEAIDRDPEFHLAKLLFVEPHFVSIPGPSRVLISGRSDRDPASLISSLNRDRSQLPAFERAFLDVINAYAADSGWEHRIVALRKWQALAPRSIPIQIRLTKALFAGRRATEALGVLDAIPQERLTAEERAALAAHRAAILHSLERYQEEYSTAQSAFRLSATARVSPPSDLKVAMFRARAAIGPDESFEGSLDSAVSSHVLRTEEALLVADELSAHGQQLAGNRMRQALISSEMLRGMEKLLQLPDSAMTYHRDFAAARVLVHAGHFESAHRILSRGANGVPDSLRPDWIGLHGVVAAHMGDSALSRRAINVLSKCRIQNCAKAAAWRAKIAYASWDFKEGRAALIEAFAEGYPFTVELHSDRGFWPVPNWRGQRKVIEVW